MTDKRKDEMKKPQPKRQFHTYYQVEGFPTKPFKEYCPVWSVFTICSTEEIAEDEVKRLVKEKRMQKKDPKSWMENIIKRRVRVK